MSPLSDESTTNAELRMQLAIRNAEIAEKQIELEKATATFRTVLALKNRKIRDLEEYIERLEKKEIQKSSNMDAPVAKNSDSKVDAFEETEILMRLQQVEINTREIRNLYTKATSATIRGRFTEISKLTNSGKMSASIKLGGADWAISICPHMDGNTKYISAYLAHYSEVVSKSFCVFYVTKLIRQSAKDKSFSTEHNGIIFSSVNRTWGRLKYMTFDDLMNPENDYVKEDSISMEIFLKVFPTK